MPAAVKIRFEVHIGGARMILTGFAVRIIVGFESTSSECCSHPTPWMGIREHTIIMAQGMPVNAYRQLDGHLPCPGICEVFGHKLYREDEGSQFQHARYCIEGTARTIAFPKPMMNKIKSYVFNAYGALLDTYLPFEKYRDELGENALVIYKLWRSKRLQYSSQLSLMNQYTSYEKVRKHALDFACDVYGVDSEDIKKKILKAHSELTCYPDVKQVLVSLKQAGMLIAVLSNGSPQKLHSTLKHAGISDQLDGVYSTELIHSYKPSPAVYEFVGEQLGLPRNKICFVSSNSWDIAGAVACGFSTVWINRYNRTPEHLPYRADHEIKDLSELLSLK